MRHAIRLPALAFLTLFALAACDDSGGGGGDGGGDGGGGGGGGTPQSQFGSSFQTAFNADMNAEPIDPQPGDLPPVDLTADPIDF